MYLDLNSTRLENVLYFTVKFKRNQSVYSSQLSPKRWETFHFKSKGEDNQPGPDSADGVHDHQPSLHGGWIHQDG